MIGGCGFDSFEEVLDAGVEGVATFDDEGGAHTGLSEEIGHAVTGNYCHDGDVDGVDGLLGGCGVGAAVFCPLGGLGVHVLDADVEGEGAVLDGKADGFAGVFHVNVDLGDGLVAGDDG